MLFILNFLVFLCINQNPENIMHTIFELSDLCGFSDTRG